MKREYGSGGIFWVSSTKVRLSARVKDGPRRTKTVTVAPKDRGGRGQAATELDRFIGELNAPKETSVGGKTLGDVLSEYVEHTRRIGRTESTTDTYVNVFKTRVTPEVRAVPVRALTARHLDDLYGVLADKGMGVGSIRAAHKAISAALEQAINWEYVDRNVAVKATPPEADYSEAQPLTPAEVARMARSAEDPVLTMAIILAALTGARRGELCGFQWADLDEAGACITLQRQLIPGTGGQRVAPPKSKKGVRRIYLGSAGMLLIEQYRRIMGDLLEREPAGWLLSYDAGATPLRAKSLGALIAQAGRDCGIKVTTHRFRKVQATQLVAAGVDVDTAARRMGHTKGVMFDHYVLGAEDKSVAAAELVEARLIEQGLPLGEIFTDS